MVVPDVEKAGRFYGPVFNPELHKRNADLVAPLRVHGQPAGIALGANRCSRERLREIDHYCALVDGYNAQAFRQELEAQGSR